MISSIDTLVTPSFLVLNAEGRELRVNAERHVLVKDEQTFKLKFHNIYNTRMQIDLYLNGKVGDVKTYVGSWILRAGQTSVLETNKSSGKLFTFVKQQSESFNEIADYIKNEDDWGLVSVRFRTEQEELPHMMLKSFSNTRSTDGYVKQCSLGVTNSELKSYNAGGIALSGSSDQTFGTTNEITKWGSIDSIYAVRLVEDKITSLYKEKSIPEYKYPA